MNQNQFIVSFYSIETLLKLLKLWKNNQDKTLINYTKTFINIVI